MGEEDVGEKIGVVFTYFSKPMVAGIELTSGGLAVGDTIRLRGHTTDFSQTVDSIQIDNVSVEKAAAGQKVGIKVKDRVRPHDEVYKV